MPTESELEICAELNLLPEHLYDAQEAAAKLGISENELSMARRAGKIEFVEGSPVQYRGWHIAKVIVRQDKKIAKPG